MVVDGVLLAAELRRRRLGRPALQAAVARAHTSTWVPGELRDTPSPLLVLAAISLARGPAHQARPHPQPQPS